MDKIGEASFNPRAHAGRDSVSLIRFSIYPGFNPRAHAGRDNRADILAGIQHSFNPRAHAGRDVAEWAL